MRSFPVRLGRGGLATGVVIAGALLAVAASPVSSAADGDDEASPEKSWVGLKFRPLRTAEKARLEEAGHAGGIAVSALASTAPAEASGLRVGDLIASIGETPTPTAKEFAAALGALPAGEKVVFRVVRGDDAMEIEVTPAAGGALPDLLTALQLRASDFIVAAQLEGGGWRDPQVRDTAPGAPITALVVCALARAPAEVRDREDVRASIARGLGYLEGLTGADGGIRQPDKTISYKNYATALTLIALCALDDEKHATWRGKLRDHLVEAQLDEGEGFSRIDWEYGAWNYYDHDEPGRVRADMSVLSWVVDALDAAGLPDDGETAKKARRFLFKCQGVRPTADEATQRRLDGGFAFSPRESKVTPIPLDNDDVVYPSYGSATADGLRTLLTLGVARDHDRTRAAVDWFRKNFSVATNPGFASDAVVPYSRAIRFYYLHGLARALGAFGERPLATDGRPRRWAREILGQLVFAQRADGSFANDEPTMGEDDPVLATALALLAAEASRQALTE